MPHPQQMRIVALAGLPGTGKSTLARELARRAGAPLLDKDRVRSALFSPGEIEYSREQDDLVVSFLYRTVEFHAARGARAVVLDGRTYSRRDQVEELCALAERLGARLIMIECVASVETVRARLERDQLEGAHPAANRSFELYLRLAAAADPIQVEKLVLRTDERPLEALLADALAYALKP